MSPKAYSIHELANIVGVSTATLRAWERRYGLMAPGRTKGGHRVYGESDLKLFLYVDHLRKSGQSLVEIGSMDKAELSQEALKHFTEEAVPDALAASAYESAMTSEILEALRSKRLDDAVDALERSAVAATAPIEFANLALNIMMEVGQAWARGEVSVSAEHLFTARIRFLLAEQFYRSRNALHTSGSRQLARQHKTSTKKPKSVSRTTRVQAVVAGLAGEAHEIGLLRVSIFLEAWGVKVHYLGPNLPVKDLAHFVDDIEKSLPPRSRLIVCASMSSVHSPDHILQQAKQLVDLIVPRFPTVLGGGGISILESQKEVLEGLFLTQSLDTLKSLALGK